MHRLVLDGAQLLLLCCLLCCRRTRSLRASRFCRCLMNLVRTRAGPAARFAEHAHDRLLCVQARLICWCTLTLHLRFPLNGARARVSGATLSLASVTRHSPHAHREESEARLVVGAEAVRLRGFSTRVHRIDALVAYKADDGGAA